MTNVLAPYVKQQFFSNTGQFLVGGLLTTYQAGSTIPIATYNSTGALNTNPVVLNSRGEADIWLLPNVGYRFVLTDSAGNQIPGYPIDNIFVSQLITLYGGVDTGNLNAYQLNFAANFTSLQNGIVLYFIASNTNTGPSTLDVNGLAFTPIINQSGSALSPGQIVAGGVTAVLYFNGNWLLTSSTGSVPQSGSFTATVTGGTNAPVSCAYTINGSFVSLNLPYSAFTSTANSFTYAGLPAILQPATNKVLPLGVMQNNTAVASNAQAWLGSTGTITFLLNGSSSGWTTSGTKGCGFLSGPLQIGNSICYSLL